MTTTTTAAPDDLDAVEVYRAVADTVAGRDVVDAIMSPQAREAAADLLDAVERFVTSEHGQALAAYHRAFESLPAAPDWVNDAAAWTADPIDLFLVGVVDQLQSISPSYAESAPLTDKGRADLDEARRGGGAE